MSLSIMNYALNCIDDDNEQKVERSNSIWFEYSEKQSNTQNRIKNRITCWFK